nr:cytidylate kinase-like family protein [Acetitomaculum ruminis]
MNSIITIGRQYGSQGHAIGEKLAKELGIPFYDKEILAKASKESGICQELFEQNDERASSSFFYSLVMDNSYLGYGANSNWEMHLGQKIFLAQFDSIKDIATKGACVIVGRCSDYVLEGYDNLVSVFIHADLEYRTKVVMEREGLSEKKALEHVMRTDKERRSYYNYYTNNRWGDLNNYHLTIDSSIAGIDGCVDIIKEFVNVKENKNE